MGGCPHRGEEEARRAAEVRGCAAGWGNATFGECHSSTTRGGLKVSFDAAEGGDGDSHNEGANTDTDTDEEVWELDWSQLPSPEMTSADTPEDLPAKDLG